MAIKISAEEAIIKSLATQASIVEDLINDAIVKGKTKVVLEGELHPDLIADLENNKYSVIITGSGRIYTISWYTYLENKSKDS